MKRELRFTLRAKRDLASLEASPRDRGLLKQVRKALGHLEANPRHPSLSTHKFHSLGGPSGEDVFTAYVQNRTPSAYRVVFYYGGDEKNERGERVTKIVVVAITPHP